MGILLVYKHEGKKMKPELRYHAVLCKKPSDPYRIAQTLGHYLRVALQEYRREKLWWLKKCSKIICDEENEHPEERRKNIRMEIHYVESQVSADACSRNSLEETAEIPLCLLEERWEAEQHLIRRLCDKRSVGEEEQRNGSVASDFNSSIESALSSSSSDDGIQSTDSENRPWEIHELRSAGKRLETISEKNRHN
uniref:PID domain-containing protein n=1 Tax=Wuchereria bancrofti TaxID=6293 RepID=A0AAF5PL16_WUCBA